MTDPGSNDDALFEAITRLLPATLTCMEAIEDVQRQLHPPRLSSLAKMLSPYVEQQATAHAGWETLVWPRHLHSFAERLQTASKHTLYAGQNILAGAGTPDGFGEVMRGLRAFCRAQEALYPLHKLFRPVSQYFLEVPRREDEPLLESLEVENTALPAGISHAGSERGQRGGFSVYIPENLSPTDRAPLVVALHGGSGHGRDFLWTWLREARSRKFVLLCPSSLENTWSIMGPDLDAAPLTGAVRHLQQTLPIDPGRVLLTGMSDGATYTLLLGLQPDSPFSHLAPLSGVLHPDLYMNGGMQRARGRAIYLVHGTLDWMFPVERAQQARDELLSAGADLVYREIPGLSHNYARAENDALLCWAGIPGSN